MGEKAKDPKVTPLSAMKAQAVKIVELPGWDDDEPIFVKLQRVSLADLVTSGQLPNELLAMAGKTSLSGGVNINEMTGEDVKNFLALQKALAEKALVEPTYEEIEENVGYLTENQLSAIMIWCSSGVKGLSRFRERLEATVSDRAGSKDVELPT